MARYQDLPSRTDTINGVVIPDITMCQLAGTVFECSIATSSSKNRLEVFGQSGASCSWTVPAGVTSIVIEMWGGGAGGTGNGNCCCCNMGIPGGAGAYIAATIPTAGGCVYTVCAGAGGSHGCGACGSSVTCGQQSYVTGFNLSNFCAHGGTGPCNPCNQGDGWCCGSNYCNHCSVAVIGSSTFAGNVIQACGEGSHVFGKPSGCRNDSISGSAPMGGGAGVWTTYQHCCRYEPYVAQGGQFPGGGGGGANQSCCCGICTCGGCGAGGLVRIWF